MTQETIDKVFELCSDRQILLNRLAWLREARECSGTGISTAIGSKNAMLHYVSDLWQEFSETFPDYYIKALDDAIAVKEREINEINEKIETL